MSASKLEAAVARLNADQQRIHLEVSKAQLFAILGQLQLACRHPQNQGPTRQFVELWARDVGDAISANDPDLRMLINMGWQPVFDVPRE